jgi:hypothetical protein
MILTHDQIRAAVGFCPDCARRQIDIDSHPSMLQYVHDNVSCPAAHALAEEYDDQPVNVVKVLHDPGCPKLDSIAAQLFADGTAEVGNELLIMPIDFDEDSEFVAKALGQAAP